MLTHRPPADPDDPGIAFLSGDVRDAVATATEAAGGQNVEVFGADVARQCLEAGLLDELVIHLAPVLLGDGVRLHGAAGAEPMALERIALVESPEPTGLRFRVAKG